MITDNQISEKVVSCLGKHIPAETRGICDHKMIFEILLGAAADCDSVGNTCKTTQDVPCGNDIRYHSEKYDDIGESETHPGNAPRDRLPPRICKGKQRMATDPDLIPYYGTPSPGEEPFVSRSQAKSGIRSFRAYATPDVIRKGKRVTAAVIAVRWDDTDVAVITRLPDRMSSPSLGIRRLLPDRVFYGVPVIRWLEAPGIPFGFPSSYAEKPKAHASRSGEAGVMRPYIPRTAGNTVPRPFIYGLYVFAAKEDTADTESDILLMPSVKPG